MTHTQKVNKDAIIKELIANLIKLNAENEKLEDENAQLRGQFEAANKILEEKYTGDGNDVFALIDYREDKLSRLREALLIPRKEIDKPHIKNVSTQFQEESK
jgi:hypothetical protein